MEVKREIEEDEKTRKKDKQGQCRDKKKGEGRERR